MEGERRKEDGGRRKEGRKGREEEEGREGRKRKTRREEKKESVSSSGYSGKYALFSTIQNKIRFTPDRTLKRKLRPREVK